MYEKVMDQEKYDNAVAVLLDAFDLEDDATIQVKVEPHQVTATILVDRKAGTFKYLVIGRESK